MRQGNYTNEHGKEVWYREPHLWLLNTGVGNFVLFVSFLTFIIVNTLYVNWHHITWKNGFLLFSVPLFTLLIFTLVYGMPTNWWQPFFGTDIIIDPDVWIKKHLPLEPNYGLKCFNQQVEDWLKESGIRRYTVVNSRRYRFLYKRDAVLFKMAWWRV